MSIASTINSEALSPFALDSWHLNLALAQELKINLKFYEDSISNTITTFLSKAPSNISGERVVIPIVFHAIVDDLSADTSGSIISPSKQNIDFKVGQILDDLNSVYKDAGVLFAPIQKGPIGEEGIMKNLPLPGLHIVDASDLYVTRINRKGEEKNFYYKDYGVCVRETVHTVSEPLDESKLLRSIPLKMIYDLYSFKNVLNVFLVNNLNEEMFTCLDAPNPFVFDYSNKLHSGYNIALPFYALGNPYVDSDNPGYGYRYSQLTGMQKYITKMLQKMHKFGHVDGHKEAPFPVPYFGKTHHKAKPLVKGVGYALGLADLNTFNFHDIERYLYKQSIDNKNKYKVPIVPQTDNYPVCNDKCVYTSYKDNDVCYSCDRDTYVPKFHYPWNGTNFCDKEGFLHGSLHLNAMSWYLLSNNNEKYSLTPLQILRIRANIAMKYINPETSVTETGILLSLINSGVPVIDTKPTPADAFECDNSSTIINNNIVEDKISYLEIYAEPKEEEAIKFLKKINAIKDIANKFI